MMLGYLYFLRKMLQMPGFELHGLKPGDNSSNSYGFENYVYKCGDLVFNASYKDLEEGIIEAYIFFETNRVAKELVKSAKITL